MIGIPASSPHLDLLVLAWQVYVVGVDSWTWWYLTNRILSTTSLPSGIIFTRVCKPIPGKYSANLLGVFISPKLLFSLHGSSAENFTFYRIAAIGSFPQLARCDGCHMSG